MTDWIRSAEAMPKPGVPVIAFVIRDGAPNGRKITRRIRAAYAPANTLPVGDDAEDDEGTYDEATDTYYCHEGWYETNEFEEVHWRVDGEVVMWQPLPPIPTEYAHLIRAEEAAYA